MKAVCSIVLLAASLVGQDCIGCGAEAGAGLANPAAGNDPDKNGDSDPTNEAVNGEFAESDITEPGVADGSWSLDVSGNASSFHSSGGTCKVGETPDTCVQDTSCWWQLKPGTHVGTWMTIVVTGENPTGAGTTNPEASANWTQDEQAPGPKFSITFVSGVPDPDTTQIGKIEPGCGEETEYVITWKLGGAPQRWEISFRCLPCKQERGSQ